MIAGLARRQHGVVGRWQLLDAGLTSAMIGRRLRAGWLRPIHTGVYLVGHVMAPHAHEIAALLAFRLEAVLSHKSAAALWNLLPYPASAAVWVTIAPHRHAHRPRIRTHRARLEARDIRHRHRMPLTSPPRTILDLAAHLDAEELEAVVAEAHYRRLASEAELHDQLARNPHKRGNAKLRRLLELPGGPQRTRSPAEVEMLRLLRRAGIDGYETNAKVHGYEVDVLWRELRFAIEVDGYDAHSGRVAFERDRLKLATLKARGVDVFPVTGRQLRDDPEGALVRLRLALERAGYRRR